MFSINACYSQAVDASSSQACDCTHPDANPATCSDAKQGDGEEDCVQKDSETISVLVSAGAVSICSYI